jgi:hypothetical protein
LNVLGGGFTFSAEVDSDAGEVGFRLEGDGVDGPIGGGDVEDGVGPSDPTVGRVVGSARVVHAAR